MPNRGDYHHDLGLFLKEQERLAQDATFQEKVDRLAGFINCDGRDVLRIFRQEAEIPVVVFQRIRPVADRQHRHRARRVGDCPHRPGKAVIG